MKISRTTLLSFLAYIGFVFLPAPVTFAATTTIPTASQCITAKTSATHASVTTRMEKDIAPYTQRENATAAITKYRDSLAIAWEAMNDPYCGFGTYGIKSAVRSYTKSTERARTAFLNDVKNLTKSISTETPPNLVKPNDTPSPPSNDSDETVARIPIGLARGVRSSGVVALQKKLSAYFQSTADESAVTGFFGSKTEALLIKFQIAKKIIASSQSPGAGLVGPKTAAALNGI